MRHPRTWSFRPYEVYGECLKHGGRTVVWLTTRIFKKSIEQ